MVTNLLLLLVKIMVVVAVEIGLLKDHGYKYVVAVNYNQSGHWLKPYGSAGIKSTN